MHRQSGAQVAGEFLMQFDLVCNSNVTQLDMKHGITCSNVSFGRPAGRSRGQSWGLMRTLMLGKLRVWDANVSPG